MGYGYHEPEEDEVFSYRFDGDGDADAGDAGGDPGKEDDEDLDDEDDEEGSDGEQSASDDGDGSGKLGKERSENIPRKRFDKVNQRLKEFRDLGMSPAEARAKLAKLQEYEKLEAQVRADEEAKRKEATRDAKRDAMDEAILDAIERKFPGFKANTARAARDRELFIERHNADAGEEIKRLATEAGLALSDRELKRLKNAIRDDINDNDELLDGFWSPQRTKSTIEKVFKVVANELYGPALQAAGAGKLAQLREKKERNMSRANAGAGPTVKTDAFSSKHPVGSPEWQKDWQAWANREQDAIFDAHGVA